MAATTPRELPALRARWTTERIAAARRALSFGGTPRRAAFGEIDGRLDLRGLPARGLWVFHLPVLRPARWRNLDLTGADLRDLFLVPPGGRIENCRFDRADCRDWRLFGGIFQDSSFVRSDLRGGMVGKGTRWFNVDFSYANVRRSQSSGGWFEGVRFDHAALFRREFSSDVLDACSFAGLVEDCQFGGPNAPPDLLRRVDFSQATLKYARFWGQDLENAVPPSESDHVILRHPRCVYDELIRAIETDASHPLAWREMSVRIERDELGPNQRFHAIHVSQLGLSGDAAGGRESAQLLQDLDGGCGET